MKLKFILFLFAFTFLASFVGAITTIDKSIVFPGDTIKLTIKTTNLGFYNIINVHDADDDSVVDVIIVNCATVCTKKKVKENYIVPINLLGQYYFATFDYAINDYELDNFEVVLEDGGGGSTTALTLVQIMNTNAGINRIVNPEQGENASIIIGAVLEKGGCQNDLVDVYLCNETLINNCNAGNFNYQVSMSFSSKQGNKCDFSYVGKDYFPFYLKGGEWKAFAVSDTFTSELDFTYTSLKAINYTSLINFGQLNAKVWNIGIPNNGIDLINFGNLETLVDWSSNGFSCISVNCTDFWSLFVNNEDHFQIDDDNLFAESVETGLQPVFITNYSLNYFPQGNLSICFSNNCNLGIGERIKTYYNMKIPDIQRGAYQGDIFITLS